MRCYALLKQVQYGILLVAFSIIGIMASEPSKLNKLFIYNSCGGTFADNVFFATYLCILEGKKIHPKDCIGSLETPVVLSQQTLI